MRIRDSHSIINGNDEVITMPSGGLEIVSDDGRALFSLRLEENVLFISAGNVCKHGGTLLDDRFLISPRASNCVDLIKPKYKA